MKHRDLVILLAVGMLVMLLLACIDEETLGSVEKNLEEVEENLEKIELGDGLGIARKIERVYTKAKGD